MSSLSPLLACDRVALRGPAGRPSSTSPQRQAWQYMVWASWCGLIKQYMVWAYQAVHGVGLQCLVALRGWLGALKLYRNATHHRDDGSAILTPTPQSGWEADSHYAVGRMRPTHPAAVSCFWARSSSIQGFVLSLPSRWYPESKDAHPPYQPIP
jgi:hypothetical protein